MNKKEDCRKQQRNRSDIIKDLEAILTELKETYVFDIGEYAYEHSIYSIESAIEILKENQI